MASAQAEGTRDDGFAGSPGWTRAAARLLADRTTAEVVHALHAAGIRPLLLKGPVIARWLYTDAPGQRGYVDVDLLVGPDNRAATADVLVDLGFRSTDTVRLAGERVPHAQPFERLGSAAVDLHHTIHDLEDVPAHLVWEAVCAEREQLSVAGTVVDTPGPVARVLHVVFHVSLEEPGNTSAVLDLRRAVEQVDPQIWSQAAVLARRFGVLDVMTAKLRLVPGGRRVCQELGLHEGALPARLLTTRQEDSPPYVHSMSRFMELNDTRQRLRYVTAKAIPTPEFLRQWTPVAGYGKPGLFLAYLLRIGWSLLSLPMAPIMWWWARHRARALAAQRSGTNNW
jgi:hypothetical protein